MPIGADGSNAGCERLSSRDDQDGDARTFIRKSVLHRRAL